MTAIANLQAAAIRADDLSSMEMLLFMTIVPGGISILGKRGDRRVCEVLTWEQVESPVVPVVDGVRRALMVAAQ